MRIAADSWTTVRVANVPSCNVWNSLSPFARNRRAARGGVRQRRSSPRAHQRHSPHGRAPAEHDAVADGQLDPLADGLDDACAFVAEQHGQRMAEARVHDVQVGVADAGRLEPHDDLARARLVERELRELEPPELADYDAAIHVQLSSPTRCAPSKRKRQIRLGGELLEHGANSFLAADRERRTRRAGRAAPRPRRARAP